MAFPDESADCSNVLGFADAVRSLSSSEDTAFVAEAEDDAVWYKSDCAGVEYCIQPQPWEPEERSSCLRLTTAFISMHR